MKKLKINVDKISANKNYVVDKERSKELTGFASIDRPWLQYYDSKPEDIEIPELSLYEYVLENNKTRMNNIAFNYMHNYMTYEEMKKRVNELAVSFRNLGIKESDNIAVASLTIPETILSFFALNLLGASVDMIDPRTGNNGLKEFINNSKSDYLITCDYLNGKLSQFINDTNIKTVINFSYNNSILSSEEHNVIKETIYPLNFNGNLINGNDLFKETNEVIKPIPYKEERIAAYVYTGGTTTGVSKKVMLTNRNFVAMACQYSKSDVAMRSDEKSMCIIPLYFPYGICFAMYVPTALGAENILISKFDATIFDKIVMEYKPNHVMGVPKYYEVLRNSPLTQNADLSFLRVAGCGGDGMTVADEIINNEFLTAHNANSLIMKGYGLTEVSSAALSSTKKTNIPGSVGIPFLGNNVSIFNHETGEELSYFNEEIGEICINSPTTMLGYKDEPEETNKLIKKHSDGTYWVHTGDAGIMDKDGNFFIKGRYKRIILRRGMTIYPANVEEVVSMSNYIEDVSVVRQKHKELVTVPIAIMVLKDENKELAALNEVKTLCEENLPDYAVPYDYRFVERLPYTKMGKVDYHLLEEMLDAEVDKKVKKLIKE